MKIEKKPQKNITELPPGCQDFVDELVDELRSVVTWNYGKCELYHWIDVLNRFDDILERACRVGDAPSSDDDDETKCVNLCTNLDDEKTKRIEDIKLKRQKHYIRKRLKAGKELAKEPLEKRRNRLDDAKEWFRYNRDVDEELAWIDERMALVNAKTLFFSPF
ncbi:uncharacterized protein [Oscarella lobularis]|uniref:uncharacterized protein n=1 Tax=Oscarella lobularis TaxID=121494 RepID=UPI003314138A